MKYEIFQVQELGNELLPCYEVSVTMIPNLWERFFGARKQVIKCVSDVGLDWYQLPLFQKIKFNSPLDKALIEIVWNKRKIAIQKLFNGIREVKVKSYVDQQQKMN